MKHLLIPLCSFVKYAVFGLEAGFFAAIIIKTGVKVKKIEVGRNSMHSQVYTNE